MNILNIIDLLLRVIDAYVIPLIFAFAFVAFLMGVYRGFLAGNTGKPESIKEGRSFALWGVIGMAIMVSVWGLVNLVSHTIPFDNNRPRIPTFNQQSSQTTTGPSEVNTSGGTGSRNLDAVINGSGNAPLPSTLGASCDQSKGCGDGLWCSDVDNTCHPYGDSLIPKQ